MRWDAGPVRGQASPAGPIPGTSPRVPDSYSRGRPEIVTGTRGATTVPQLVMVKSEHSEDNAAFAPERKRRLTRLDARRRRMAYVMTPTFGWPAAPIRRPPVTVYGVASTG